MKSMGCSITFKIQSVILDIWLISLNILFVNYKRRYVHELSLFNIVLYNPTQLPFMNPPPWITVCGPFAPSGWSHFKGSDTKEIILWLWLLSSSTLLCETCDCSTGYSPKVTSFTGSAVEFQTSLFWSGFQAYPWREEVVHGRSRSRSGIRTLVFHSQLHAIIVAWC